MKERDLETVRGGVGRDWSFWFGIDEKGVRYAGVRRDRLGVEEISGLISSSSKCDADRFISIVGEQWEIEGDMVGSKGRGAVDDDEETRLALPPGTPRPLSSLRSANLT